MPVVGQWFAIPGQSRKGFRTNQEVILVVRVKKFKNSFKGVDTKNRSSPSFWMNAATSHCFEALRGPRNIDYELLTGQRNFEEVKYWLKAIGIVQRQNV